MSSVGWWPDFLSVKQSKAIFQYPTLHHIWSDAEHFYRSTVLLRLNSGWHTTFYHLSVPFCLHAPDTINWLQLSQPMGAQIWLSVPFRNQARCLLPISRARDVHITASYSQFDKKPTFSFAYIHRSWALPIVPTFTDQIENYLLWTDKTARLLRKYPRIHYFVCSRVTCSSCLLALFATFI